MEDCHDAACGPWFHIHKEKILTHTKPRSIVPFLGSAATARRHTLFHSYINDNSTAQTRTLTHMHTYSGGIRTLKLEQTRDAKCIIM